MGIVGIVANPQSGKDMRRLTSAAGQVSDGAKVDIVRQVAIGALECGADRVVMAADRSDIATRAAAGLGSLVELLPGPATGSHLDTVDAARRLRKLDASVVVGLGGDGTCRDLADGWPALPLIAVSTGTNNVYPLLLNPTAAGMAAGHLATDVVALEAVSVPSKRIVIDHRDGERYALVDVALVETNAVGARAVTDPGALRWILACQAGPDATGMSAVVARAEPVEPADDGAVLVRLGPGGHPVRAPLAPGMFHTFEISAVERVVEGESVPLDGTGVLAFDGERECIIEPGMRASIDRLGPQLVDIGLVLRAAQTPVGVEPRKGS